MSGRSQNENNRFLKGARALINDQLASILLKWLIKRLTYIRVYCAIELLFIYIFILTLKCLFSSSLSFSVSLSIYINCTRPSWKKEKNRRRHASEKQSSRSIATPHSDARRKRRTSAGSDNWRNIVLNCYINPIDNTHTHTFNSLRLMSPVRKTAFPP